MHAQILPGRVAKFKVMKMSLLYEMVTIAFLCACLCLHYYCKSFAHCDLKCSLQDGVKFVSIGAMFSELVAVSSKGELYQWKWSEPEPYRNAQVGN